MFRIVNDAYFIENVESQSPYSFKNGPRFNSVHDEVLIQACQEKRIIKAVIENKIVGVLFWQQISPTTLYFGPFAVSTNHQGQGIGKLLLQHIEALAIEKKLKNLAINVVNHRVDLIPWYESLGFKKTGEMEWPKVSEHLLTKPSYFYSMIRSLKTDDENPTTSPQSSFELPIHFRGGCHCRSVTYYVTSEPESVCYCHCSICRKISGTIVVPWITVSSNHLHIIGTESLTIYHSTSSFCRQFCNKCGTQLFFHKSNPSCCETYDIDITYGTIDHQTSEYRYFPTHHIWYGSKDVLNYSENLPKYEERKHNST